METQSLKRVGLLQGLSDDDLRTLAECAQRVTVKKDQEVLHQGQRNGSLFLVADGLLHVRVHSKGHDVLLGRLEPGSFFGEISLFDPGPTTASVHAVSDGHLIEVSRAALERFVARCPAAGAQVLARMLEGMATRLRRADERLIDTIMWGGLLK